LEEDALDGVVVELPEDCAAIGNAINSMESSPARKRKAGRKMEFGDCATLIFSL
jgi:hypothetical protein